MTSPSYSYQRRNSLRHPGYDYAQSGAYFVTICAHRRRSVFGQIIDNVMLLNPLGKIAHAVWEEFPQRHPNVCIDTYVIMPNHVHVLMWLARDPELVTDSIPGPPRKFGKDVRGSLSTLIGAYKGSVTRRSRNSGLIPTDPLWQRNFYDHVVRSEADAQRIRAYIESNPARWLGDQLHPNASPNRFNRGKP